MATITDPRDIIVAPVVSEKSYGFMEQGVCIFLVHTDANETQIEITVQEIPGVKVASVNTLNHGGRRKRSRTGYDKCKNTKCAYVTLVTDSDPIDIFGGSAIQPLVDEEVKGEQKYSYS